LTRLLADALAGKHQEDGTARLGIEFDEPVGKNDGELP